MAEETTPPPAAEPASPEAPPSTDAPAAPADLFGDTAPEWARSYELAGESPDLDLSTITDPDVQRQIAAVRSMATARQDELTSGLKAEREALEQARVDLKEEQAKFRSREREWNATFLDHEIEVEPESAHEPDPMSAEGAALAAKRAAQAEFQKMLTALKAKAAEEQREQVAEEAEVAKETRIAELREFQQDHPDLLELKDQIQERRKVAPGLRVEDAYFLVKRDIEKAKNDRVQSRRDLATRGARSPAPGGRALIDGVDPFSAAPEDMQSRIASDPDFAAKVVSLYQARKHH